MQVQLKIAWTEFGRISLPGVINISIYCVYREKFSHCQTVSNQGTVNSFINQDIKSVDLLSHEIYNI
jgi:hypothetical protein